MENKDCGSKAGSCSTEKKDCSAEKKDCGTATAACGDKKSSCCPGTMIKGALLGAIVMFGWFWISCAFLPWHKNTIQPLKMEKMAATLLANTAPADGVYVLPYVVDRKTGAVGPEAVSKPYAFISVYHKGYNLDDKKKQLMLQGLLCLLGGALLTAFLKSRRGTSCCPTGGALALGVFVGAFAYLPNAIWFHFPLKYSLVGMADCIIAISLAGLVITRCVLKSGACGGCGCGGKCPCCAGAGCCTGKCGGKCPCPCCSKSACGDKAAASCSTAAASCGSEKPASCGGDKPAGGCGDKKGGCGG